MCSFIKSFQQSPGGPLAVCRYLCTVISSDITKGKHCAHPIVTCSAEDPSGARTPAELPYGQWDLRMHHDQRRIPNTITTGRVSYAVGGAAAHQP